MELSLYALGAIGILIHFLKKLLEYKGSGKKMDRTTEIISSVISILIMAALVYSKDDLEAIFPITKLGSVLLGFSSQSIFRSLVKSFNKTVGGDLPPGDPDNPKG
jgi:hypothetical protein